MINKQRVKRIKNLIYASIILVLFLPLILMSVLSFRMIGLAEKMSMQLDDIQASVSSQIKTAQTEPDGGYVIEPEDQGSRKTEDNSQSQDDKPETADGDSLESEDAGMPDSNENYDENGLPITGGNIGGDTLVRDDIGINGSQSGTLNPGEPTQVGTGAPKTNGADNIGGLIKSDSNYTTGDTLGTQDAGNRSTQNPKTGDNGSYDNSANGNPLTGY